MDRGESSGQDGWSRGGKTPVLNALWAWHWEMKQVVSTSGKLMGGAGEASLRVFGVRLAPEYLTAMHLALVAARRKPFSGR